MVTKERIGGIELPEYNQSVESIDISSVIPEKHQAHPIKMVDNFGYVPITSLFTLRSGDYHKASSLPNGKTPLISCGDTDNGIMRLCKVPMDATYSNALTVAYNGSWPLLTKYHPYRFAAKDDVAVCLPKRLLKLSTLVFIQYVLSRETWRYSYGRKCFKEKLSHITLRLPVKKDGEVDEDAIEELISNTSYWEHFKAIVGCESRNLPSLESYFPS